MLVPVDTSCLSLSKATMEYYNVTASSVGKLSTK